jgi:hypothetical protein
MIHLTNTCVDSKHQVHLHEISSFKDVGKGNIVVEALCYKPRPDEVNPSGRTTPWGLLSL